MAVPLIGPDGRKYEMADPANIAEAEKLGYRVVTPEAPVTTLEQLKGAATDVGETLEAGAHGVLKGVTGGLYGMRPKQTGEYAQRDKDTQEDFNAEQARLEQHPVAHGVGEFAGMVLSPINKVGLATKGALGATTAIGRIGAGAAAGAAEGVLYGAGNTMSEAALGDTDLTAEKMIAGIGLGGLLGMAGGGLGAGLEEGIKAVAPTVSKGLQKAGSMFDGLANDQTIAATRAQQGVINKMSKEQLDNVATMMRERGHLKPLSSADDILKSVETDVEKTGASKGAFLDAAEASGSRPSVPEFTKAVDDFVATKNPLEQRVIRADVKAAKEALEEIGQRAPEATGKTGSSWRALDDLKQTVQKNGKFSKGPTPLDDVTFGLKRELAGVFRSELDRQLLPALGKDAAAFTEAKATYGALKDAQRLAKSGTERVGGLGLKDIMTGGAFGILHPAGIAAAIGSKVLRERGPAIIATMADAISKNPRMGMVAASFGKRLETAAPNLGQYAAPLLQAYEHSPAGGLATHIAWSKLDPAYAQAAQGAGFLPETPEEQAHAEAKAGTLAAVGHTIDRQNTDIENGLKSVFKGERAPHAPNKVMGSQDFGARRMRRDGLESHNQRVKEFRELSANPEALVDRVAANIGAHGDMAPGMAAAMTKTAHTAVAYLASQSQEPPKAGPLARNWRPTEAEQHEFAQKLEVVENPLVVLKHASSGTLVPQQIEALQAVYPLLAAQIRDMATDMLTDPPKEVPYRSRLMLSMITGIDVDGTMGQAIAINQDAINNAAGKPGDNGKGMAPDGKDAKLGIANRFATPQEKRELGDQT